MLLYFSYFGIWAGIKEDNQELFWVRDDIYNRLHKKSREKLCKKCRRLTIDWWNWVKNVDGKKEKMKCLAMTLKVTKWRWKLREKIAADLS